MVKTIGIGKQDFSSVIEDNCFFVDKTRRFLMRGALCR